MLIVLIIGVAAGFFSAIIGTGSSMILLPALTLIFGPREAIPVMAIAAMMANAARVFLWRREIDWRACMAYVAGGAPFAALGVNTMLMLPAWVVEAAIGAFFLAVVLTRPSRTLRPFQVRLAHLPVVGACIGYLSGIVVSTGPISIPVFLAYGLTKGSLIGTEAAVSLAVYLTKSAALAGAGVLSPDVFLKGVLVGLSMSFGTAISKPFLIVMPAGHFGVAMDLIMLASGLGLILIAANT